MLVHQMIFCLYDQADKLTQDLEMLLSRFLHADCCHIQEDDKTVISLKPAAMAFICSEENGLFGPDSQAAAATTWGRWLTAGNIVVFLKGR